MIIIIEDDEISGRLLTRLLQEFFPGKEFLWLRSIKKSEAYLTLYQSFASDLLLLDIYLEDGSAWDLLEQFQNNNLSFKGKIILMPGIPPNKEEMKLIKKYQPYKILLKPVQLKDLEELMNE